MIPEKEQAMREAAAKLETKPRVITWRQGNECCRVTLEQVEDVRLPGAADPEWKPVEISREERDRMLLQAIREVQR